MSVAAVGRNEQVAEIALPRSLESHRGIPRTACGLITLPRSYQPLLEFTIFTTVSMTGT